MIKGNPMVSKCVNCDGQFRRNTFGVGLNTIGKDLGYATSAKSFYFCQSKCEQEFAEACAEANVRRIGGTLVRFNKGDRRAS
jgi:hypothetical protein